MNFLTTNKFQNLYLLEKFKLGEARKGQNLTCPGFAYLKKYAYANLKKYAYEKEKNAEKTIKRGKRLKRGKGITRLCSISSFFINYNTHIFFHTHYLQKVFVVCGLLINLLS